MPKEQIQFLSSNGAIATETLVRWTHEDQGGHVQICIQRYPLGQVAEAWVDNSHLLSGVFDNVLTGLSTGEPAAGDAPPVIRRGDSIRGDLPRTSLAEKADIDPTKVFPPVDSPWVAEQDLQESATVEAPIRVSLEDAPAAKDDSTPRTGLGGSYVLPPADDTDLVGREPDGSVVLWTDPLDRTAINKLIKVLRRARDQAYGKDE